MNSEIYISFKQQTEKYCNAKKVLNSTLYPERFEVNQGTCWLCWMRLTRQDLIGWRKKPYCDMSFNHDKECPVCGYSHWAGATWFPFIYLQEKRKILIGNPSFRRIKDAR